MEFYVLISDISGAKNVVTAVFSKEEYAINILNIVNDDSKKKYRIANSNLVGEYNYPNKIFAGHNYNSETDSYEFVGLFADNETALKHTKKPYLVIGYIPDDRFLKHSNSTIIKEKTPAYFLSLHLQNIKCFKDKQVLHLSKDDKPYQWTVILGDNGVGKTTLLQCLASVLELSNLNGFNSENTSEESSLVHSYCYGEKITSEKKGKKEIIASEILQDSEESYISISSLLPNHESKKNNLICYAYGASRHITSDSFDTSSKNNIVSLFSDEPVLINAEKWLLNADHLANRPSPIQEKAKLRYEKIKTILKSILPDIEDITLTVSFNFDAKIEVSFKNSFGYFPLNSLSLGYKSVIVWMVDLASRMFDRYPDSENPLEEPAIVIIDEIDLHLHPKWQREIIEMVTKHFKNTQFIVTAHSPLIVQSAPNANIVLLKKEGDHVVIDNDVASVKGWRVDQILVSDLFDLKSSRPKEYDDLLEERKNLLSKSKLTKKDKDRIKEIEKIVPLPVGETTQEIKAMDLILKFAKKLEEEEVN